MAAMTPHKDMNIRYDTLPALPIAAGLAAGIFMAVSLGCSLRVAGFMALTGIALLFTRWGEGGRWLLFIAAGITLAAIRTPGYLPEGAAGAGSIEGRIVGISGTGEEKLLLDDCVWRKGSLAAALPGKVSLLTFGSEQIFHKGDIIRADAKLYPAGSETYPKFPDSPDYSNVMLMEGVMGRAVCLSREDAVLILGHNEARMESLADASRRRLEHAIATCGTDEATTAFLLATIAGDSEYLDPGTIDRFRISGVAHVLAISGLHVGIIAAILMVVLGWIRILPGGRRLYFIALAIIVLLYGFITGMSHATARAVIMMAVFAFAGLMQRPFQPLNALFVTLAIWLFVNPFWLYAPGLQLSFGACVSIIVCQPVFNRVSPGRPMLRATVDLLTMPLSAMIGTAAFVIAYFHALPAWFLPVNIVAGVLVTPLVGGGAVCALLNGTGMPTVYFGKVINGLYALLDGGVSFFAGMPAARLDGLYAGELTVLLMLAATLTILFAVYRRTRLTAALAVLTLAFTIWSFSADKAVYRHGTEAYVLPSRQHTMLLLRDDTDAWLSGADTEQAIADAQRLCGNYLEKRGCTLYIATDSLDSKYFVQRGNVFALAGKRLLVVNGNDNKVPDSSPDYLLVGKGFTGDIVQLAESVRCDTVLLAMNLHAGRRARYLRELRAASVPVRDLSSSSPEIALR